MQVLTFFERQHSEPSREWLDRQMRKIRGGVREIARLIGRRDYAVGDRFGLGDIAAGTVLGYIDVRFPAFAWRPEYPDLVPYADRPADWPSFRATVPVPQVIRDRVM